MAWKCHDPKIRAAHIDTHVRTRARTRGGYGQGVASADKRQLTYRLTRTSVATARSKPERQQDHLIDAPLVLADARALEGLEDFPRRRLKLIPDITPALQEEWVTRVDHHRRHLTLDY